MNLGPINIGFTGTRKGMTFVQRNAFWQLLNITNGREFHHGDCVGADSQAHDIAFDLQYIIIVHPPSDNKLRAYCQGDIILSPKPYEQRNRDIVQASDLVIAAPPTEQEQRFGGTWQTVRFAREYNKPCKVVLPSGIVVDA